MGRKEEFYILLSLIIALSGVAALPQLQPWLDAQLKNPLFLPLIGIALLLLLALPLLRWDWVIARLRALVPKNRLETRYLHAVEQTYGKTPALLAGSESTSQSNLTLLEAFSPLTLRPDRDDGSSGADDRSSEADECDDGPRGSRIRLPDGRRVAAPRAMSQTHSRRELGAQIVYWALWAIAQALPLAVAAAVIIWLLWSSTAGGQRDGWRIALALLVGGLWLFGAFPLHAWLVSNDGGLAHLLRWWQQRREGIAEPGTPGAEIWAHPRLLIRGHPGSGKTTLMRHLAVICARERQKTTRPSRETRVRTLYGWPDCPFPLYIPLRALDLTPRHADLLTVYSQKVGVLLTRDLGTCNAAFFADRLRRGGCLVLLDAFDELRDAETRTLVARLIAALPPGPSRRPNRFVVTSRIVGYEGQLNGEGFVRRRVEDLDDDQAARFIRARYMAIAASERRALDQEIHWNPERQAESLIRRLPNNPGLRRLSRNPLLLSLTVALHYDHRGKGLQLPEERYRLYEEALRLLVRDWDRRKDADASLEPTDDRSDLTLDERLHLLRELAWMMFEQSADGADARAHAVVRGDHASAKLAELLALLPGFAPDKAGAARRSYAHSEAERWRQNISQRGGVLQELGNVPGSSEVEIQFAHLTFQEYLAARAAATEDSERRLTRILERWDRPAWREVLLLYAASHDATPVIRHLLAQPGIPRILQAGAVLLERPTKLTRDLQDGLLERLRDLAFVSAAASEEQANEALRQLEERTALPERADLLRAFQHAPYGPIRARALELALGRSIIAPQRDQRGVPSPPPDPDLVPILRHACEHDPHHLPRLAAGYTLSGADPRFAGDAWIPQMVHIPAGPFLMGSSDADPMADSDEKPQHRMELPDYWIGTYPVTVAQWRRFVKGDGYTTCAYWTEAGWRFINGLDAKPWYLRILPTMWSGHASTLDRWQGPETGDDNLPVVNVSWFEAVAYCRWLSAQTGHAFYLPSEAEWEKAARGPDGRIWPWGNTWEPGRSNSEELSLGRPSPVGSFPDGVSPYGVHDMAGNVYEWCATKYGKGYPYQMEDEWAEAYLEEDTLRRLRGGRFGSSRTYVRGAYRNVNDDARYRTYDRGLRVASRSPMPGSVS